MPLGRKEIIEKDSTLYLGQLHNNKLLLCSNMERMSCITRGTMTIFWYISYKDQVSILLSPQLGTLCDLICFASVRIPDDGSKCRSTIQQRGYAAVTESADLECRAHHFEPDPPDFSMLCPMSLLPGCHVLSWLSHDLPIVSTLFQKTHAKRFRLRDKIINITTLRRTNG